MNVIFFGQTSLFHFNNNSTHYKIEHVMNNVQNYTNYIINYILNLIVVSTLDKVLKKKILLK